MPIRATLVVAALAMASISGPAQAEQSPGTGDSSTQTASDQRAINSPSGTEISVDALAASLTTGLKTDREKARAIFNWVAGNIAYNTAGFFSGNTGDNSVQAVLRSRLAVCTGYSGLFEALARSAGMEAVVIQGYGRGYGYQSGVTVAHSGPPNHAWNAVKIDGQWQFVDATWGAGFVDGTKQWTKRLDPFYFLTPPSQLVYSHLPLDPRWQLLPNPISSEWYHRLPGIKEAFFRCHLALESHTDASINAGDSVTVTISAPQDTLLLADLEQGAQKLPRQLTFIQRLGEQFRISAVFPAPGSYTLRIYAKDRREGGPYQGALEYRVESAGGAYGSKGFPFAYGKFYESSSFLYSPMSGSVEPGVEQHFELSVPGATRVLVQTSGQLFELRKRGSVFSGPVLTGPDGAGVFASFGEGNKLTGLLKYDPR